MKYLLVRLLSLSRVVKVDLGSSRGVGGSTPIVCLIALPPTYTHTFGFQVWTFLNWLHWTNVNIYVPFLWILLWYSLTSKQPPYCLLNKGDPLSQWMQSSSWFMSPPLLSTLSNQRENAKGSLNGTCTEQRLSFVQQQGNHWAQEPEASGDHYSSGAYYSDLLLSWGSHRYGVYIL